LADYLKIGLWENMTELKKEKCMACSTGALTIPEAEIAALKPQIPEWQTLDMTKNAAA